MGFYILFHQVLCHVIIHRECVCVCESDAETAGGMLQATTTLRQALTLPGVFTYVCVLSVGVHVHVHWCGTEHIADFNLCKLNLR